MSNSKAFQIEVLSPNGRQVFFVESESEEASLTALAEFPGLLPHPAFKLQRRLSDSELDLHQIGPGDIVQWI